MIPIETLILFFLSAVALALSPGPDNIFVLTQSALYGRKAGIFVTLGLCTGLIVHTAAVALGVAAIFKASALAFNIVKLAGVGYLLYLAWGAFRASASNIEGKGDATLKGVQLYYRGVLMNITNPKVAIFFLAFLPQFASPANGSITLQMLILGGVFMIAALLTFGSISLAAGFLGGWLKESDKAQVILNRVAGTVFVGLALKLAITSRS